MTCYRTVLYFGDQVISTKILGKLCEIKLKRVKLLDIFANFTNFTKLKATFLIITQLWKWIRAKCKNLILDISPVIYLDRRFIFSHKSRRNRIRLASLQNHWAFSLLLVLCISEIWWICHLTDLCPVLNFYFFFPAVWRRSYLKFQGPDQKYFRYLHEYTHFGWKQFFWTFF